MKQLKFCCLMLLVLLLTGGCASRDKKIPDTIQVVLEEGEGFEASSYICQTQIGEDVSFMIKLQDGYRLTDIDCGTGTPFTVNEEEGCVILTLENNRYTHSIRIRTEAVGDPITYKANGGQIKEERAYRDGNLHTAGNTDTAEVLRNDEKHSEDAVTLLSPANHLGHNTSTGTELFYREGYTLTGWNTMADGSGLAVGLGSRTFWKDGLTLYAQWKKWADPSAFDIEISGDGCTITGYHENQLHLENQDVLVIPGQIDGRPVWQIGQGAFAGSGFHQVILPDCVRRVEKDAFAETPLEEIWLFDSLLSISDYAFRESDQLRTLHINAATAPVYSNNYFATFADKFDRLLSLQEKQKIVLFSGSSTRFGYDCSRIDQAFVDYQPVNMGVFAYTNAYPQLLLILDCMKEGDVLVDSPEFDAALRQFCTHNRVEDEFFAMCEANYDLATRLDLRQVGNVFAAFTEYLNNRIGMEEKSYFMSPIDYDEDGNKSSSPVYNEYGDYILYRPNADNDNPIYGLPVDYTVMSFRKDQFIDPLNQVYQKFLDRKIQVFFTYAPRNRLAVSEASTPEAIRELDLWFRDQLCVPVLTDIEESLFAGTYLYGTDNHLSTAGVAIRTEKIIEALQPYLSE